MNSEPKGERARHQEHEADGRSRANGRTCVPHEQTQARSGFRDTDPPIAMPGNPQLVGRLNLLTLPDELADRRAPEDECEHTREQISNQHHRDLPLRRSFANVSKRLGAVVSLAK